MAESATQQPFHTSLLAGLRARQAQRRTRVVQAAGRLIRSSEDTGIIVLLDRRFLRYPYRRHLPGDWVPDGGVRNMAGDPSAIAREFFGAVTT